MQLMTSPLLTDLYQFNMIQAYLERDALEVAVFEFFVRNLPPDRGFLIAAGLHNALEYLENFHFSSDDIHWLKQTGRFSGRLLDYLAALRFTGNVDAMPEGTIFFANEPILRITAPLPQAQLIETRIINILHFQSLIASKAARMVLAAPGKTLVDFGMRRAHGAEAGLMGARASYLAGFAGTATVLAGRMFGIPLYGTMAHSFIQTYDNEKTAFADFAAARPQELVLLIDTYDTETAARKVVALAPMLKAQGIKIHGVRLDSGDIAALSQSVRCILDEGRLSDVIIFASGGLDEYALARFTQMNVPIDGYGIGTSLLTSSDVPALDCAYKLQEYAGLPRRKRSSGKETWPSAKQVWRRFSTDGCLFGDTISTVADRHPGTPLLQAVMREGKRVNPCRNLVDIRASTLSNLRQLPDPLQVLRPSWPYPVEVADSLLRSAAEVDRRLASQDAPG